MIKVTLRQLLAANIFSSLFVLAYCSQLLNCDNYDETTIKMDSGKITEWHNMVLQLSHCYPL